MKRFITTTLICLLAAYIAYGQDNQQRQPENRQQSTNRPDGSGTQNSHNGPGGFFPGGGFPGAPGGGFPGFPGGGFPGGGFPVGGPGGGFPGMMFGAMGNIDQFGVGFNSTPLKEKDNIVTDSNDSTSVYYVENIKFNTTVKIKYNGSTAEVSGNTDGLEMKQDGAYISFHTKNQNVEYILSGNSSNGGLLVKSDHPVKIVFDNVDLKSEKGEAIAVTGKADTYVVVKPGSRNRLEDKFREVPEPKSGPFGMMGPGNRQNGPVETEVISGIRMKKAVNRSEKANESPIGGVLTSKGLLCISGSGSLTLKGHNKSGMKSSRHMVIRPGNVIHIETTQGKGLSAKGDIRILGGVLNVDCSTSGKDGIRSDECIYISGGRTTVKSGNVEGSEGIEAKFNIVIDGGTIEVASFDDAINSGGNLIINDGYVFAAAVHNDALDSNSNLVINGGTIVALGSGMPECGLDACDEEGFGLYINGGTIACMGGMTSPCAKESRQGSVICGMEQIDSAMIYSLEDDNHVILQLNSIRNYQRTGTLFFSSPELKEGQTYHICKKADNPSVSLNGFRGLSIGGKKCGEKIETVEKLTLPYSQIGRQTIMMMGPPPGLGRQGDMEE